MESKSFIKILRKVIREEVQSVVRKELHEMMRPKQVQHQQVIEHGMNLNRNASRTKREIVKDPILNDILNETVMFDKNEWPTMDFKSEMARSFGMMQSDEPVVAPATDINNRPVDTSNDEVNTVINAMTRDYSALMAAIDKRKR